MNNIGTKTIETDRLILRKIDAVDDKYIYNNWASDDRVTKHLTWPTHGSIEVTKSVLSGWLKAYDEEHCYRWGIQLKDSPELIGMIDVVNKNVYYETCEIGYVLMHSQWGKGIMTEALTAVLDFLLNNVGFYLIELRHSSKNPASGRVMEKCGMVQDAVLPHRIKEKDGSRSDMIYYSIKQKI